MTAKIFKPTAPFLMKEKHRSTAISLQYMQVDQPNIACPHRALQELAHGYKAPRKKDRHSHKRGSIFVQKAHESSLLFVL